MEKIDLIVLFWLLATRHFAQKRHSGRELLKQKNKTETLLPYT